MSRLENNHTMLRDAATVVLNLQYAVLEKYEVFFRGKLIF